MFPTKPLKIKDEFYFIKISSFNENNGAAEWLGILLAQLLRAQSLRLYPSTCRKFSQACVRVHSVQSHWLVITQCESCRSKVLRESRPFNHIGWLLPSVDLSGGRVLRKSRWETDLTLTGNICM